MKSTALSLPGVLLLEPEVLVDARGFFFESFNRSTFASVTGLDVNFVQDNHSRSSAGVLRGLHYQVQQPQGKLLSVARGAIFTVAVDMRRASATFGQWVAAELSGENHRQLWIPVGFAHGFLALSEADLLYKTTDFYAPHYERCVAWNDSTLAVSWPLESQQLPRLSVKDSAGLNFKDADFF